MVGALGMLGCVGQAMLEISGYLRHVKSGDQAGTALGRLFLIVWFIPATAAVLNEVRRP